MHFRRVWGAELVIKIQSTQPCHTSHKTGRPVDDPLILGGAIHGTTNPRAVEAIVAWIENHSLCLLPSLQSCGSHMASFYLDIKLPVKPSYRISQVIAGEFRAHRIIRMEIIRQADSLSIVARSPATPYSAFDRTAKRVRYCLTDYTPSQCPVQNFHCSFTPVRNRHSDDFGCRVHVSNSL